MASQFTPMPPPGAAPFAARPQTPRGLYRQFGMPESLIDIHFPSTENPGIANPWYWYFNFQQPMAFSFLGGVWGPGWVRKAIQPVIKILAADTQPEIPIPPVGFKTLEQAVKTGQPDITWGRIDFEDDHFWTLIQDNGQQNKGGPKQKPKFNQIRGQIRARDNKTNINQIIKNAANLFTNDWVGEANQYNALASGVNVTAGFKYPRQPALFSIPAPDGPPTSISRMQQQLNAFGTTPPSPGAAFLGPLPVSAFFNINTISTQAYAFTIKVGQLDPKKWNMSEFPPLDATLIGNGTASAISGDFSGFGATPFPLQGPELV